MSRLNRLRPTTGTIEGFCDQEDRDFVAAQWADQGYITERWTVRLHLPEWLSHANGLPDDYRVDITVYMLQACARRSKINKE